MYLAKPVNHMGNRRTFDIMVGPDGSQTLGRITIVQRSDHCYDWVAEGQVRPHGSLEDLILPSTPSLAATLAWAKATATEEVSATLKIDGEQVVVEAPDSANARAVWIGDDDKRVKLGWITWEAPHGRWKWTATPVDNSFTFDSCDDVVAAVRALRTRLPLDTPSR